MQINQIKNATQIVWHFTYDGEIIATTLFGYHYESVSPEQ